MPPSHLRLYVDTQFASPYAMSAFVALTEKGLNVELTTVNLAEKENQSADFAAKSLTRRVPTLEHGEFFLSESSAIAEYIDECFPGTALYPAESRLKARARQVQAWLRSDFMPIRQERTTEVVFYGTKGAALSADARHAAATLCSAVDALLTPGAAYVCGQWSIADVDLAIMLKRLALDEGVLPDRLADYASRQWARPSVQQWVHQDRPPL